MCNSDQQLRRMSEVNGNGKRGYDEMTEANNNQTMKDRAGMIMVNDLIYKLDPDLSVAVNKTHKNHYFQQNNYTSNQTSICILNSGADYVDCRRSFLSFDIELTRENTGPIAEEKTHLFSATVNRATLAATPFNANNTQQIVSQNGKSVFRIVQGPGPVLPLDVFQARIGQLQPDRISPLSDGVEHKVTNIKTKTAALIELELEGDVKVDAAPIGLVFTHKFWPEDLGKHSWVNGYFGPNGSVLNLIDTVTVSSRSGDELSRVVDVGLLSGMSIPWMFTREWVDHNGGLIGFGDHVYGGTDNEAARHALYGRRFVVPMYLLSPLFTYGRLMPAMLMSGLRVEIRWKDAIHSMQQYPANYETFPEPNGAQDALLPSSTTLTNLGEVFTVAPVATMYDIKRPEFSLCSVQLSDSVQRSLNEVSAVNGLEIVYCDWDRTEQNFPKGKQLVNIEIRKSASRALMAVARARPKFDVDPALYDEYRSYTKQGGGNDAESRTWTSYQWQLGSLYFPQQKIIRQTPHDLETYAYAYTLDAFDKFASKTQLCSAVPFRGEKPQPLDSRPLFYIETPQSDYYSPFGYNEKESYIGIAGSYVNGQTDLAVTLERSSLFNLSGIPINNSRVLLLRGDFEAQQDFYVTVFMKYVKLCRVFLNNIEVEQ